MNGTAPLFSSGTIGFTVSNTKGPMNCLPVTWNSRFAPQQSSEPEICRAQLCRVPTVTDLVQLAVIDQPRRRGFSQQSRIHSELAVEVAAPAEHIVRRRQRAGVLPSGVDGQEIRRSRRSSTTAGMCQCTGESGGAVAVPAGGDIESIAPAPGLAIRVHSRRCDRHRPTPNGNGRIHRPGKLRGMGTLLHMRFTSGQTAVGAPSWPRALSPQQRISLLLVSAQV